jgi:hypothetical protein
MPANSGGGGSSFIAGIISPKPQESVVHRPRAVQFFHFNFIRASMHSFSGVTSILSARE